MTFHWETLIDAWRAMPWSLLWFLVLVILLAIHLRLRRRHRLAKTALTRIRRERDELRARSL